MLIEYICAFHELLVICYWLLVIGSLFFVLCGTLSGVEGLLVI